MFWGSFSGSSGKGPILFWEKEWGTITAKTYCERVVPLICGWFRIHPDHQFMQDNASPHKAALTLEDMKERGIQVIEWPPYSPDLNPIEWVWNKMKDWLMEHYPNPNLSYDQLRQAVHEAWQAVGQDYVEEMLLTMPLRCQAVIDANGLFTPW
jgi:hypothetical protein